ncbi:hypothetical protein [Nocardia sp. NPDC056100]|uniref:hypothetical protein n=1 Tax=Nocardia sp. NPDC056100 TaxID=3345712 RepID=UPI0035DEEB4B
MIDVPTPQEALNIAAATTERARTAPILPVWAPPIGGVLGGIAFVLVCWWLEGRIAAIVGLTAITLIIGIAATFAWSSRAWQNGGPLPRSLRAEPAHPWQRALPTALPLALFIFTPLLHGWWLIPLGVVAGAWIWFNLSRRQVALHRA